MSYLKNQRSPGDASAESEDAPNFEPYPVVTPPKDGLLSLAAATSTNEMEIAFSEDFEPLPYSEMEHYALGPQVADFLESSPGHDAILGDEELGVLDNWQDDDPALPELSVENEENLASEVSDFKQLYTSLSDDSILANVATEDKTKDVLPCLSMCKSTDECPSEQETSVASANEVTGPDNSSTSVAAKVKQAPLTTVLNNRAAQSHGQAYYYPWHYYSGVYHHPHTHLAHAGYSHYNQRHHAYNTQGYHHGRPYPPPQSNYYPRQGYTPTVPCGRYSKPLYMAYAHIPIPPQSYIKEVSENDVICGRGGKVNNHPGNKRFRQFIHQFKREYMNETKQKKPMVALRVIDLVKRSNPPGRFLIKFPAGYLECSEDRAREKASQALREGVAKLRKSGCADDFSAPSAENDALKAGVKVKAPELPKSEDVNYWNDPAFCDDFNPPGPKVKEEDMSTKGNQEVNKSSVKIVANSRVKGVGTIETIELPSNVDWRHYTDSIGDDMIPPCKRIKKEDD